MAGFMNAELEAIRDNLECGHCRDRFKGSDSQARKVKYEKTIVYCSTACRSAAVANKLARPLPNRGPCKTCGVEFFSRNPKVYCSMACYTKSDQFRAMQRENAQNQATKVRESPPKKPARTGSVNPCLECAGDVYSQRGRQRKFCSQGCYRAYMAKRFDRWIANPEGLALPQCYDEFLDGEELQCMIDGCGWVGKSLSAHVNRAHGIIASEFKRAAGFNLSTGVISRSLAEVLRAREPVGFGKNPDSSGLEKAHAALAAKGTRYSSKEASEHRQKARALPDDGPSRVCVGCGETFQQSTVYGKALYCSRECRSAAYAQKLKAGAKRRERKADGTFKWV